MPEYRLEIRNQQLVNTDPQRRCYNGAHCKSELIWTPWKVLQYFKEGTSQGKMDKALTFWRELNDHAISQRGESARSEFRIVC